MSAFQVGCPDGSAFIHTHDNSGDGVPRQVEFKAARGMVRMVSIEGGEHAAYKKAPAVFLHRMRLDAIVAAIADRRKIVTPTWATVDKVLNLDLKTVMSTSMMSTLDDISASEEETD